MKSRNDLRYMRYCLLAVVLLSQFTLHAQSIIIGAGTQSGVPAAQTADVSGPIYRSTAASGVDYSKHHYLYTQTDLVAAGLPTGAMITALSWNKDNTGSTVSNANFSIWIKNSSLALVQTPPQQWSTLISGSTQTYNAATAIPASTGFIDFTFGSPFIYTGDALEISVDWDISAVPGNPTTAGFSWTKDPISDRNIAVAAAIPVTTLTQLKTTRPQLKITYTGSVPVKLIYLTGNRIKNDVLINWGTTSEINFSHFEVERSLDGLSFVKAGTVNPKSGAGHITYDFTDAGIINAVAANGTFFYRLKMIDKDGRFEYSKIVTVKANKEMVELATAYPNPFNSHIIAKISLLKTSAVGIILTDATGRSVSKQQQLWLPPGENSIPINGLGGLNKGIYVIKISIDGKTKVLKIIKQ